MTGLVFFHGESGMRLKIDELTAARLLEFAQVSPRAAEAGGTLLGRRIAGCLNVVIDAFTAPAGSDRRSRHAFFRSAEPHQRLVDQAWRDSGGTVNYLGEWHTHPEPCPRPSGVDLSDWRRRLKEDTVDAIDAFFLIVGTSMIRSWRGERSTGRIDELTSGTEPVAQRKTRK